MTEASRSSVPAPTAGEQNLAQGREDQRAGRMAIAMECFAQAVDQARASGDRELEIAARRHLAIAHHLRGEPRAALHLCLQSRDLALEFGHDRLAAQALIALGNFLYEEGRISAAQTQYRLAAMFGTAYPEIQAAVAQNMGILACVRGRLEEASDHFHASLKLYRACGDLRGEATAYHNLGMACADRRDWDAADQQYAVAVELARRAGEWHLEGLCLLNQAELHLAHQRYEMVRGLADQALAIFRDHDARLDQAGALRMLGVAYSHLDRPTLAESRLRSALEIADATGQRLLEAETSRDLAVLCLRTGRRAEAASWLDRAGRLFEHLDARLDLQQIAALKKELTAA